MRQVFGGVLNEHGQSVSQAACGNRLSLQVGDRKLAV